MAQRRKHDWAALFAEYKTSGKTAAAFCAEKQIHQNLWYKHKPKMNGGFIEVAAKPEEKQQTDILILTSDFEIKVKPHYSEQNLLSLIKCLGMNHAV